MLKSLCHWFVEFSSSQAADGACFWLFGQNNSQVCSCQWEIIVLKPLNPAATEMAKYVHWEKNPVAF